MSVLYRWSETLYGGWGGAICTSSWSCSGVPSFAQATALSINPNDPFADSKLADEVWDEYNDLFAEGHINGLKLASSVEGAPFYQPNLVRVKSLESPIIVSDDRKSSADAKVDQSLGVRGLGEAVGVGSVRAVRLEHEK
ncbi:hypothetical protein BKA56DRAFT_622106 [Ilyonectria sp. MPI-CAGE-AT-0026]|nr:hypothetical protein BKA56DRAFT_622106 [Ilyonectria sp. MPI-CAGE-AT-0026]